MKPDELFPAALETRLLAGNVFRTGRRDIEQRLEARGIGVGALPYGVMRLLSHQAQTISELSQKMQLTPATLVPVVDALERNGYAQRGRDPKDRRRTPLSLTERGAEVVARVPPVADDDILVQALVRLGDDKSRQLLALLRELVAYCSGEEAVDGIAGVMHTLRDSIKESERRWDPEAAARQRR